jgi:WAS/WASL-interacting protein
VSWLRQLWRWMRACLRAIGGVELSTAQPLQARLDELADRYPGAPEHWLRYIAERAPAPPEADRPPAAEPSGQPPPRRAERRPDRRGGKPSPELRTSPQPRSAPPPPVRRIVNSTDPSPWPERSSTPRPRWSAEAPRTSPARTPALSWRQDVARAREQNSAQSPPGQARPGSMVRFAEQAAAKPAAPTSAVADRPRRAPALVFAEASAGGRPPSPAASVQATASPTVHARATEFGRPQSPPAEIEVPTGPSPRRSRPPPPPGGAPASPGRRQAEAAAFAAAARISDRPVAQPAPPSSRRSKVALDWPEDRTAQLQQIWPAAAPAAAPPEAPAWLETASGGDPLWPDLPPAGGGVAELATIAIRPSPSARHEQEFGRWSA